MRSKWSFLRPFSELEPLHRRLLERSFQHYRETGKAIGEDTLLFEESASEKDKEKLKSLQLLRVEKDAVLPSLLGLLFLEDADDVLDDLDVLVGVVKSLYRPGAGQVELRELSSTAKLPSERLKWLVPWARELELTDASGALQPHRRHRELRDLESQLVERLQHLTWPSFGEGRAQPAPFDLALTSLGVRRYRALGSIDLAFDGLKVLVGPNGVGKSTVLGALRFLGRCLRSGVNSALAREGGFDRIRTSGLGGPIELDVRFRADWGDGPRGGRYELAIDSHAGLVVVERERLTLEEANGPRLLIDGRRGRATILAPDNASATTYHAPDGLVLHRLEGANDVIKQLSHALARVTLVDRDPGGGVDETGLHASLLVMTGERPAKTAAEQLLEEIAASPLDVERLEAFAKQLLPSLARLHRRVVTGEPATLEVEEVGLAGALRLRELSSGTRQILMLAAIYVMKQPPAVLLVEEPDGGVHPGALPALADLLRSIATRTAVLCTTHGPAFVETLDPKREVLALTRTGEGVQLQPLAVALESQGWLRSFGNSSEAFRRSASERP